MTREACLEMAQKQLGGCVDFLAAALGALSDRYYSWPQIRWRFWVAQSRLADANAWLAMADGG